METKKVKWTADYGSHTVEHNLSVVPYSSIVHKAIDYHIVGHTAPDYYLVFRNKFNGQYIAVDTLK